MIPEIIFALAILVIILFIRIVSVTLQIQKARSFSKEKSNHPGGVPKREKPAVTLIVLGSGGHTTENSFCRTVDTTVSATPLTIDIPI